MYNYRYIALCIYIISLHINILYKYFVQKSNNKANSIYRTPTWHKLNQYIGIFQWMSCGGQIRMADY